MAGAGSLPRVLLLPLPARSMCVLPCCFTCCCRAGVAQLQAQHGPDYVVTAADVKAVTAAAMAAAMQNRGLGGARM